MQRVDYAALAAHVKRNALFLVAPQLALLDVGLAVVRNRAPIVAHWLREELLRRPTAAELDAWEADASSHAFSFLIVQPYVLAQLVAD